MRYKTISSTRSAFFIDVFLVLGCGFFIVNALDAHLLQASLQKNMSCRSNNHNLEELES